MPFFKDRTRFAAAHHVLGGWHLSGAAIFDSGNPLTVTNGAVFRLDSTKTINVGGDYNADNSGGDRPNAPLTAIQTVGFSRQQFLTGILPGSAFPAPAPGTDGSLGRNTIRGPGIAQVDLSLAKSFKIGERVEATLRGDAYNAFNRVNLANPSLDLNSVNFGKSTNQNTARLGQVSLRISF